MHPFTTAIPTAGSRLRLPMQVEGVDRANVVSSLSGDRIVSIAIPEAASLQETWFAQLTLSSGRSIEISGSSTEVGDWVEHGTVNLSLQPVALSDATGFTIHEVENFVIQSIRCLRVDEGAYEVEAGLVFTSGAEREISVASIDIPAALSIGLPGTQGPVHPQFEWARYRRALIE